MFGLFKGDFGEIDSFKYQMIAVSASTNALAVTMTIMAHSSRQDEETLMLLYNETLAFAVCLAQMRIQKKFKLNDGHDIVTIIQELQRQFRDLPVPRSIPRGQDIAVTRNMLDNATTDGFFERAAYYAARDYHALKVTDEAVEAFCGITRQVPSIITGAGWTMALLIFQIRTTGFLLQESELPERLPAILNAAREGCQFMMDKFDHVLSLVETNR
jgi:galactitol-specific phosphotransferase system IIB component